MRKYEFMRDTDEKGNSTVNISDKPKRRLDLIPRLICLLIALVIWLWMVNFNDTDVTETMVLKIQINGIEQLEGDGMMIYGLDKREITVTVKGSNRDLKKYDESNYSAVVDVSDINEAGQYTLPLLVTTPSGSSLTIAESEPLNVSFITDFIEEKTVPLDVFISNSIQDIGHVKYSYEYSFGDSENTTVTLKGPKQVVEYIESARFSVDGTFALTSDEKSFSGFSLTFLDENLNQVNVEGTDIDYSTKDIEVNVKAVAHKSISVRVEVSGEGSNLVAKPTPESIEVWGTPSEIMTIYEYVVRLDKAEVGKTATHTLTNEELPEGLSVKENVVIIVSFEERAE